MASFMFISIKITFWTIRTVFFRRKRYYDQEWKFSRTWCFCYFWRHSATFGDIQRHSATFGDIRRHNQCAPNFQLLERILLSKIFAKIFGKKRKRSEANWNYKKRKRSEVNSLRFASLRSWANSQSESRPLDQRDQSFWFELNSIDVYRWYILISSIEAPWIFCDKESQCDFSSANITRY